MTIDRQRNRADIERWSKQGFNISDQDIEELKRIRPNDPEDIPELNYESDVHAQVARALETRNIELLLEISRETNEWLEPREQKTAREYLICAAYDAICQIPLPPLP